jgi:[ribosomal protein S5]-alanine N-acetyltransferase
MLNHVGTQTLDARRVTLRKYTMDDAEDMFRNWVTDPEVSRFGGWEPHKHIEEIQSLLSGWIDGYSNPETYHWVIVLKDASQAIGCIYLNDINNEEHSVSVHYLLSRQYWNQGIMTEACKCVLDFAFSVLGVVRVHTHHHVENPASGKVQQKCGMRYVKTAYRQFPACEQISGNYCYYELTIDEWKQKS